LSHCHYSCDYESFGQPDLEVKNLHFDHFGRIVRMPDDTDAEKILITYPLENWRRPPGHPRTTWMKTIQQDLKSNNLSLNEANDVAQNRPLWRLCSVLETDVYV